MVNSPESEQAPTKGPKPLVLLPLAPLCVLGPLCAVCVLFLWSYTYLPLPCWRIEYAHCVAHKAPQMLALAFVIYLLLVFGLNRNIDRVRLIAPCLHAAPAPSCDSLSKRHHEFEGSGDTRQNQR